MGHSVNVVSKHCFITSLVPCLSGNIALLHFLVNCPFNTLVIIYKCRQYTAMCSCGWFHSSWVRSGGRVGIQVSNEEEHGTVDQVVEPCSRKPIWQEHQQLRLKGRKRRIGKKRGKLMAWEVVHLNTGQGQWCWEDRLSAQRQVTFAGIKMLKVDQKNLQQQTGQWWSHYLKGVLEKCDKPQSSIFLFNSRRFSFHYWPLENVITALHRIQLAFLSLSCIHKHTWLYAFVHMYVHSLN